VRATLRVRATSSDPSARPDKDRLQQAASALSREGFDVLHVGRFGVTVSSDTENFSRVFGVEVNNASLAPVSPQSEDLRELLDGMQLDSEPEYFRSQG
jgi:hypothetical protein